MKRPELPTRLIMGPVVWTATKIMKNWKVIKELLTTDLRSGGNHSAVMKCLEKYLMNGKSSHP